MMRYNLSCKPFDTQAYVSVLSAQGSLRIASASLWLDPFTVMPAAASNAAAINPFVNRLIALSFSMQTPPARRLTASASAVFCGLESDYERTMGIGFLSGELFQCP